MPQAFKCPSCGAPLEYQGGDFQECEFCGSNVLVPKSEIQTEIGFDLNSIVGKAHKLRQIMHLARTGNKIAAIREYRETFGVGLAEAKDAVERLERGEAVSFQNISFQTPVTISPETQKKALKFAGIFGGSMIFVALIPAVIGLAIAGFVVWKVFSTLDQATNNTTKPSFAQELMKFGGKGEGTGKFEDNRDVAVDKRGNIYVGEYQGGRIQVFDASGKFMTQWVADPGMYIGDMAVDGGGNLCILWQDIIHCYNGETGALIKKYQGFRADGFTFGPGGKTYTVSSRGELFVFDPSFNRVVEMRKAGESANAKTGFEKVAVDSAENIYTFDRSNGDICKFSQSGQFLNRLKSGAKSPNHISIDSNNRIYVSDGGMINILDTDGGKINSFPANQSFGMVFNDAGELLVAQRPYVVKYKLNN